MGCIASKQEPTSNNTECVPGEAQPPCQKAESALSDVQSVPEENDKASKSEDPVAKDIPETAAPAPEETVKEDSA